MCVLAPLTLLSGSLLLRWPGTQGEVWQPSPAPVLPVPSLTGLVVEAPRVARRGAQGGWCGRGGWVLRAAPLCRDFAYVARDQLTQMLKCHVFRCESPAKNIATSLHEVCSQVSSPESSPASSEVCSWVRPSPPQCPQGAAGWWVSVGCSGPMW